ncbi:reverse transcriptase domain-containing protein [Tanacetum coccineum]
MSVYNSENGDNYIQDPDPVKDPDPDTLISKLDISNPLHLHFNDTTALIVVSIKLKGTQNYQVWSCAMLLALEGKNKTDSISEELFLGQILSKRAKHIWEELKETYDIVDGSIMFGLHHQINTLKQNGSSIVDYYHKLNALWKQFDAMIELSKCVCNAYEGFKKHNQLMKLMQFLMGLDDSYMQIRSFVLSREVLPDVRSAYATISSEESHKVVVGSITSSSQRNQTYAFVSNVPNRVNFQRNTHNLNNGSRSNNLNNNRQGGGSGLVCENCGFNGHTIDRCFKIIGYPTDFEKKKSNQSFKEKNASSNNSVGTSSFGFTDEQMATLISHIKDNKNGKNVQANMTVDSEANQHMTYTDKELDNVIDISHLKIKADGESEPTEQRPISSSHDTLAPFSEFPLALVVSPPGIRRRPAILVRPGEAIPFGRLYRMCTSPTGHSRVIPPLAHVVAPLEIRRRPSILVRPGEAIPFGRLYRTHLNGSRKLLTTRKRVRPIPARRLAWRRVSTCIHHVGISDGVVAHPEDSIGMGFEIAGDVRDDDEEFEVKASAADTREVAVDPLAICDSFRVFLRIQRLITTHNSLRQVSMASGERTSLVERIGSLRLEYLKEKFRQVRRDRDDTQRRLRRLKSTMTITRSGLTPEAIEELINRRVEEELAAYKATRAANALEAENPSQNGNNGDNGNGGEGNGENGNGENINPNENNRDARHVARECTYQDFMKCQSLNFKGTKGFVRFIRWFEKMETVFDISNCLEKYQQNLTVKNNDLAPYTQRFQELTMMCTKMVPKEDDRVEKFIGGLPDNIQGNVIAAEPIRLQDAVRIANNLMDQKLKGYAMKKAENKRRLEVNQRDNRGQQPPFKRPNCNKVGHLTRDCKVTNPATSTQRGQVVNHRVLTCFECGRQGHFRSDCPKLKDQNRGNKAGNKNGVGEARGKAYVLGGGDANPDSNVVNGIFLLNNHYTSMIFDSRADRSFVSTTFSALFDITPDTLDVSYAVELADGRISETNTILKGCSLGLLGHPFSIYLMPVELGSFDVIISMDWLANHRAVIVCDEKIMQIPYGDEVLIVQGDRDSKGEKSKLSIISCTKTQKYIERGFPIFLAQVTKKETKDKSEVKRLEDVPTVRYFPEVIPEDLPGLPPTR